MKEFKLFMTLAFFSFVFTSLTISSLGDAGDFVLSGKIAYIARVSKSVVTQAKYSLTITNNLREDVYKDVYLFLRCTDPGSVVVSSPDASISGLEYIGKYCLLRLRVLSKAGSRSFELSFNSSGLPINVRQEIYVNDVQREPSSEGESYFLVVEKGDVIVWKIRIVNGLEAVLVNGSYVRPAMPIVVKFYLDEKYLKKLEVNPETNSTILSEPNSLSWHLVLRDSVDICVKAQVSELTEWGIIPTRSLSVEFDSDQYDYYVDALSSRRDALDAMLGALKTILNGSDLISSGLYNISDVLDVIGAGVSRGGSATAYVGSALTSASGQIQPIISALREYSSLLKLVKDFSSRVDLAEAYAQINRSLPAIHSSLSSSYNVVNEDLSRLLQINNTLNQLLQTSEDEAQRSALVSAAQAITAVYNNNLKLRDTIGALMRSVESLETALAGVSVDQIRQLQALLAELPDVSESYSALADQIKAAGDALTEIGRGEKEAGKALSDLAAHIRELTNATLGASSPLTGYYNDLSRSLSQLDEDLSLLRLGKSIFLFSAPRERLSLASSYMLTPGAHNFISFDAENVTFVNYLAIPKSSLQNIRVLDGFGREVNNLTEIGSWEHAGLVYIPLAQRVENNNLDLVSWDVIPFTLNVSSPSEVLLATSGPIDTEHFEVYCSVNVEQPMLVSKVGLAFLPPESHATTTPQTWDLRVLYALALVPIALALIYLFIHERKKSIYRHRKSILEKYESVLKGGEQTQRGA